MPPPNYGAVAPEVVVPLGSPPDSPSSDPSWAERLCPRGCLAASPGYGPAWRWMLPLAAVFLNECICLSMLYPFLGYMVVDLGLVPDKDQAGQYVGYIAAMFTLGQLLTGTLWGRASDRFGRRRVICAGLFASMLLSPLFGLATSLWQAMAVRFLLGLFNGNAAAAKAYIGEAASKETQDLGFSLVAICWSFGNVFAAVLGGLLSRPAIQYPELFAGSVFATFPYLLPCVVSSGIAGVGWLVTLQFLPEQPRSQPRLTSPRSSLTSPRSSASPTRPAEQPLSAWSYVWEHSRCHNVFAIYFLISFLDYGMFEVYPLWAISSVAAGGLAWTPAQVGFTQMGGGAMLLVGNLVLLPLLRGRFGSSLRLQQFAMLAMAVPGFSLFPLASVCCAGDGLLETLAVLPVLFLRITSVGVIFTLTFQYINGMVHDRAILGEVTGAAQQAGNVARFITPTLSAWLVAFSNTLTYPGWNRLPFLLFGLGWLLPVFFNSRLSEDDISKYEQAARKSPTRWERMEAERQLLVQIELEEKARIEALETALKAEYPAKEADGKP